MVFEIVFVAALRGQGIVCVDQTDFHPQIDPFRFSVNGPGLDEVFYSAKRIRNCAMRQDEVTDSGFQ